MATAHPLLPDPVLEALRAPIVQTMTPERRVQIEEDLRAMAARGVPEAMLREAITQRLQQEDDLEPLAAEELAELEHDAAEAEEDLRAGRCISVEKVFAGLGIPYRPARAG